MNERWWIDARHREKLEAVAPCRIAAWVEAAQQAEILSSDRQSVAARLPRAGLFVKWRHTSPARRRKTWGRASRERREAQSALCARALGIPGPRPCAVAEVRARGVLVAAVLIRPFDLRAQRADEVLAADETASQALAQQLRQWHATGWRHGDCYPKNVLLLEDRATFAPIGYPSAQFAKVDRLDAARVKDLAQLCVGVQALGETTIDEVVQAYAPGDETPGIQHLVQRRIETIQARKQERERTRPQREPEGPSKPDVFTTRCAKVTYEDILDLV